MIRILARICLVAILSGVGNAVAQAYPARPVRVILPQLPGSSVDAITRIVTTKLGELMGQQFVVDNRGGAGGLIGAQIGARATPDGYTLTSGAASSLIITSFTYRNLGFDTLHVPYKGGMSATSVMTGETQWCILPAAALVGHIKAGRVRALGISSKQRSPLMPDLPTIAEAGVPGYEYTSWNGLFAPRGTPRSVVMKLHAALQKVLAAPDLKQMYANQGLVPEGSASPEAFAAFFRADFERVAKLVKLAGVKPE